MCDETSIPHRHRASEGKPDDRLFKIRNILNLIFIIVAVAGVGTYYLSDHTTGIIIVLASMVFKMTECCLRFFRK